MKQLLDPLGSMCKLIGLYFCELNTKISIHNHILLIQKPSNYQPLVRKINCDTRENVSELLYIIIRLIKWYLIEPKSKNIKENWESINKSEEIINLLKYLCISLKKLQETYEYGNVTLTIQFYINIIEDALNNNFNENKLPKYDIDINTLLDYNKLKNFWDYSKIKRISDAYGNCFQISNDDNITDENKKILIDGYLSSVNGILQTMDNEFQNLISIK